MPAAEWVRSKAEEYRRDGRARAKAKCVHMGRGRPPKLTPHQRQGAIERRERGDTLMDIARTYGVAHSTIARLEI